MQLYPIGRRVREGVYAIPTSTVPLFCCPQCLATLVPNVPYQRLKPGLLSKLVKQLKPFLSHRGRCSPGDTARHWCHVPVSSCHCQVCHTSISQRLLSGKVVILQCQYFNVSVSCKIISTQHAFLSKTDYATTAGEALWPFSNVFI